MSENIQKQLKICMALISFVLFVSVVLGYIAAVSDPGLAVPAVKNTLGQYAFIKNLNLWFIFLFIFFNNTIKAFLVIVFGTILGIVPLFFVFINGQLIGLVIGVSASPARVLLGIAPHGILEIPAILISAGYGLWLGYHFYRFFLFNDPFEIYFTYAVRNFFKIVMPMLFVAALIETFITPLVIKALMK